MINELYQLMQAMERADVGIISYHNRYQPIPNVSEKAPCVRIVVNAGRIAAIESIDAENAKLIRKYGPTSGTGLTYPAFNLKPLYKLGSEDEAKLLKGILKATEKLSDENASQLLTWSERSELGWTAQERKDFSERFQEIQIKLKAILGEPDNCPDVFTLMEQTAPFADTSLLLDELRAFALKMLEERNNLPLALRVLFNTDYDPKHPDKKENLSVIFDSDLLQHNTVGKQFTQNLNKALLEHDKDETLPDGKDAFGAPYTPDDTPMPKVKLAAGFTPILRTMNSGAIASLTRYGRGSNDTYPIATTIRLKLASSLRWLGEDKKMEGITWIHTGIKDEALFAYPSSLPQKLFSFTQQFNFGKSEGNEAVRFSEEAKRFMTRMNDWKKAEPDTYPENIQIFVLRKLDKGHTKTVYRHQLSPERLIRCGKAWGDAANNLPGLPFPMPDAPYPLQIAGILNRIWKQDGTLASDKFKEIPSYHGVQLQLNRTVETVERDLRLLVRNSSSLAAYAGNILHATEKNRLPDAVSFGLRDTLVVFGMLLYWTGIEKESYMESEAYLLGQLLQLSDSLHELYCKEVRSGQLPPQFVGSSLYSAAAEYPEKTFAQLGQRIRPYVSWARTHRGAQIVYERDGKEYKGANAGTLLWMFKEIATQLETATMPSRFNDREKAELFIGYMAAFKKPEKSENDTAFADGNEEESL